MHFVDEAKIQVKAGDGGNGCISFRREARTPRGGPSGGDGGHGGTIILQTDPQLSTLMDFRYKRHYKAQRGEDGRSKDQYGKGGRDLILRVPIGTVVYDAETGEVLVDLDRREQQFVAAKGGRGGQGNIHFKTAWNQAPRIATEGTKGELRQLRLELKLLADVGLIGFPSVGKSTMISVISKAKPKIAAYPFTTLRPNLGLVRLDDERTIVVADIPGLISGAADGAGLGHQFLRHVERTSVLVHIVEANEMAGPERDPLDDFDVLSTELRRYAPDLASKPQLVAVNKIDIPETRDRIDELRSAFAARGFELYPISAATREGLPELLEALWVHVRKSRTARAAAPVARRSPSATPAELDPPPQT